MNFKKMYAKVLPEITKYVVDPEAPIVGGVLTYEKMIEIPNVATKDHYIPDDDVLRTFEAPPVVAFWYTIADYFSDFDIEKAAAVSEQMGTQGLLVLSPHGHNFVDYEGVVYEIKSVSE